MLTRPCVPLWCGLHIMKLICSAGAFCACWADALPLSYFPSPQLMLQQSPLSLLVCVSLFQETLKKKSKEDSSPKPHVQNLICTVHCLLQSLLDPPSDFLCMGTARHPLAPSTLHTPLNPCLSRSIYGTSLLPWSPLLTCLTVASCK